MTTDLLVVCDIDGTVADFKHREHYLEGEDKQWDKFISPEEIAKDPLIPGAREALVKLARQGAKIVFLTGRNESLRATTQRWLIENLDSSRFWTDLFEPKLTVPLLMRPVGDDSVPSAYKEQQLIRLVVDYRPRVMLCLDDDPHMYRMYLKFGGIPMKAPECWDSLYKDPGELPEEKAWRK